MQHKLVETQAEEIHV